MKNSCLYIVLFTLFGGYLYAADSTAVWKQWVKGESVVILNTKAIQQQTDNNRIRNVEVLDMRAETSCLGLFGSSEKPFIITTQSSLGIIFNSKLSNDTAGQDLLAVISDLWINEAGTSYKADIVSPLMNEAAHNRKQPTTAASKIKTAIDIFIMHEGKYYPLVRLDTTLNSTIEINHSAEELINGVFSLLNKKVTQAINDNRYLARKSGNKEAIEKNYNLRFNIPVLTDAGMKPGVYESWQQFKNNQPDNKVFRIQKNQKEPPTLYVKNEDGTESLTRNIFAVCDGKHIYKVYQGYVCDMYRNKRSLYWLGVSFLEARSNGTPSIPLPSRTGYPTVMGGAKATIVRVTVTFPCLLNLDTGREY